VCYSREEYRMEEEARRRAREERERRIAEKQDTVRPPARTNKDRERTLVRV
jgi:hypothetical protein